MRIDHHNQQLLRLINQLFPIFGTSLLVATVNFNSLRMFNRKNVGLNPSLSDISTFNI